MITERRQLLRRILPKVERMAGARQTGLEITKNGVDLFGLSFRKSWLKLNSIHRHYTYLRLFVGGNFTVSQAHQMSLADDRC